MKDVTGKELEEGDIVVYGYGMYNKKFKLIKGKVTKISKTGKTVSVERDDSGATDTVKSELRIMKI